MSCWKKIAYPHVNNARETMTDNSAGFMKMRVYTVTETSRHSIQAIEYSRLSFLHLTLVTGSVYCTYDMIVGAYH